MPVYVDKVFPLVSFIKVDTLALSAFVALATVAGAGKGAGEAGTS